MNREFTAWIIIFLTAYIGMQLIGTNFGIALILAELGSMSWRMK